MNGVRRSECDPHSSPRPSTHTRTHTHTFNQQVYVDVLLIEIWDVATKNDALKILEKNNFVKRASLTGNDVYQNEYPYEEWLAKQGRAHSTDASR